jgi:Cu/Ag efflux pump CusA
MQELRSVSRAGLSGVTVVFRDGTDVWFARQLVTERLREVEGSLPPGLERPQLAPVSSGLGEIYWFVVRSPHHSPSQLRTILDWEIAPKLRGVPGVVELNTMDGDLKQYEVRVDPARLQAHRLPMSEVVAALERANRNAGGGYVHRGGEAFILRGEGQLRNRDEIGKVVIATSSEGTPVLVEHVASVEIGAALRYGVVTSDGEGEVVAGITMMLLGQNSRDVTIAVRKRVEEIQDELPPGVVIEPIYDRSDFVGRTLQTVATNLVEGALVVLFVPPPKDHGPQWIERLTHAYERVLPAAIANRWWLLAGATVLLLVSGVAFANAGADFVPRIFEGDAVVTVRRAPSIGLDEARRLDLEVEKVLETFPEVLTTVGMTGRSEVAYDPVGNDSTEILVRLRPMKEWTSSHDFDGLSELFKTRIESNVPGTFVSVSQPIEDRTNELISGSRADVAIQVFGPDLDELRRASERIGDIVRGVRGAGNVRVERLTGQPMLTVRPDRVALARHGVRVDDVFDVL